MTMPTVQDKQKEIAFFDAHAASDEYDVFTPKSNARLIAAAIRVLALPRGARVVDLGCGSGVFTELLRRAGYASIGLDISAKLILLGRQKYPGLELIEGDAENLPFDSESVDGVLLSNLVHHFPDPRRLAAEVRRVLKRCGRFAAFDPNRVNPFMWLYRDRASPFYSSSRRHRKRAASACLARRRSVSKRRFSCADGLLGRPFLSLCRLKARANLAADL